MATFVGVVPLVELSEARWAALESLHVAPAHGRAPRTLIEVAGGQPQAEDLARRVSSALEGRALAMAAQTSADVYVVAEYEAGELRRRIVYDRDGGGWREPEGEPRDWEGALHFARPLDAVLDDLEDDEEEPDAAAVAATKRAFGSRDVRALPRLPRPNGSGITSFVKSLGVDPSAAATYRPPGFFRRIFGRT